MTRNLRQCEQCRKWCRQWMPDEKTVDGLCPECLDAADPAPSMEGDSFYDGVSESRKSYAREWSRKCL